MGSHLGLVQSSGHQSLFLDQSGQCKRFVKITEDEKIFLSIDCPWEFFKNSHLTLERVSTRFALKRQWEKIQNNQHCPAPRFQQKKIELGLETDWVPKAKLSRAREANVCITSAGQRKIVDCYNSLIERRLHPFDYHRWRQSALNSFAKVNTTQQIQLPPIEEIVLGEPLSTLPRTVPEPVILTDKATSASIQWQQNSHRLISEVLNENPNIELLYFDHDHIDDEGLLTDPIFKPTWNTRLLFSGNYVGPVIVIRPSTYAEAVKRLKRVNTLTTETTLYQWLLTLIDVLNEKQVMRFPETFYSINTSTTDPKYIQAMRSTGIHCLPCDLNKLEHYLNTADLPANAIKHPEIACLDIQFTSSTIKKIAPSVDIIIPTRDRIDLLSRCIETLLSMTQYLNYTITVVDNNSEEVATKTYLDALVADNLGKIIVRSWPHEFNYSAINNFAASKSEQDILVLLNNDTEITQPNWLSELVSELELPNTGCVGAKLIYPSKRIQHAGVMTGSRQVAGHAHRFFDASAPGYLSRLKLSHHVAAVTAACLAIKKAKFLEVGGLNEEHLAVAFNDVDLCLKVRMTGQNVVWTPKAELIHHESISRGLDKTLEQKRRFSAEFRYMQQQWGDFLNEDCAWHPVFGLEKDHWEIAAWCQSVNT